MNIMKIGSLNLLGYSVYYSYMFLVLLFFVILIVVYHLHQGNSLSVRDKLKLRPALMRRMHTNGEQ